MGLKGEEKGHVVPIEVPVGVCEAGCTSRGCETPARWYKCTQRQARTAGRYYYAYPQSQYRTLELIHPGLVPHIGTTIPARWYYYSNPASVPHVGTNIPTVSIYLGLVPSASSTANRRVEVQLCPVRA
eukprot:572765-Rhodomonas_salina.1